LIIQKDYNYKEIIKYLKSSAREQLPEKEKKQKYY